MPGIIKVQDIDGFDVLVNESKNKQDVRFEFSLAYPVTDKMGEICQVLMENPRDSLCLDFTNHPLSDEDISELATFLQSDKCPNSINLILAKTSLSMKSLEILAATITQGCNASEVKLGLGGNRLRNEGAVLFAHALQSEHSPAKVSLNLANNEISDKGVIELAEMLKLPGSTKKLSLNLLFNPTTKLGSAALIEGMECGSQKDGLNIIYEFSKHGTGVICNLANTLKSNKCPEELSLQFGVKHLTTTEVSILFDALKTITTPSQLELDLSEQGLKDQGFAVILKALEHMPEGLKIKLHLAYNAITQEGAEMLSSFIRANKLQAEVYMDLTDNSFGGETGRHRIHDAMVHNPQILSCLSIQGPTRDISDLCRSIREHAPEIKNIEHSKFTI
ncbi:hypothetical protein OQJ19_05165 [Fluoribacter gormanii]|uniref:hypothetical protein n=1 Tax=Fluoribacter gormanii TaxID=464 RepID=UPI002243E239|nr:hypothetical protein [Fluoribacter gormanii]MCW8470048.1 hypothetical protein [Fluoribacter gormanii]